MSPLCETVSLIKSRRPLISILIKIWALHQNMTPLKQENEQMKRKLWLAWYIIITNWNHITASCPEEDRKGGGSAEGGIYSDESGFVSGISCCPALDSCSPCDVCKTCGAFDSWAEESRRSCLRKGREKMKASRRAITGVGSSWIRRKWTFH